MHKRMIATCCLAVLALRRAGGKCSWFWHDGPRVCHTAANRSENRRERSHFRLVSGASEPGANPTHEIDHQEHCATGQDKRGGH
jgi:hypothetical protein